MNAYASRLLSRLKRPNEDEHAGLVWISIWPMSSTTTPLPVETFTQCLDQIVVPKLARSKNVLGVWNLRNNSPAARGGSAATNHRPVNRGPHVLAVRHEDLRRLGADGELEWLTSSALGQRPPLPDEIDNEAESPSKTAPTPSALFGVEIQTFRLIQRFASKRRIKGKETDTSPNNFLDRGRCIVAVAIEPAPGQETDIDNWYRNEHLQQMAQNPMHIRSSRYELSMNRLDGACDTAPRLLTLHEFISVKDMLDYAINSGQIVPETPWSKRIFAAAVSVERTVWEIKGKHSSPGHTIDWL